MNKKLDATNKLIKNQDTLIRQLKGIIDKKPEGDSIWLELSTTAEEGYGGIDGAYFLEYNEGKFQVVDLDGVKIPHQLGIEIEQDLDQWMSGVTTCKVEMFLNAYVPKKGTKENPWTKQEIEDMKKAGHPIFNDDSDKQL